MTAYAFNDLAKAGAAAVLLLMIAASALAAGGHFDVDDATVLAPGHTQIEAWYLRSPSEGIGLQHLDGSARVGEFELGLNLDRATAAQGAQTTLGPQIKWVSDPLLARLSAGVVWAASLDTRDGHLAGSTVYIPLTWWAGGQLQIHVNGGADWVQGEERTRRLGIAAEWAASDVWSLIIERSQITHVWASRLGLRCNVNAALSIDVSAARRSTANQASYAIGLNREFGSR